VQFAVSATVPGWGPRALADLCRFAEDLGYREAWLAEVAGPEAFTTAAAVAAATRSMDVGIAVAGAYTRTPAVLAMAAASVGDLLGERRLALGIGSSSETIVSRWNGLPFARPLRRVRETVEAVRAALGGDGTYRGDTVSMERFKLAAGNASRVEVWVGALNPGMLGVAGAAGDGVCLNMMGAHVVPRQLDAVRAGAASAGRTLPDDFGVMARLHVLVTDDPEPVRAALRATVLGPYLAQPVYNRFLAWCGYEEEASAIAAGWAAGDREAVARALHPGLVEDLTLMGPARTVRERLEEFAAAGVTVAALSVPTPDRTGVEGTLRALAPPP
jgi:probable F420-dependent oxidoreductase